MRQRGVADVKTAFPFSCPQLMNILWTTGVATRGRGESTVGTELDPRAWALNKRTVVHSVQGLVASSSGCTPSPYYSSGGRFLRRLIRKPFAESWVLGM